MDFRTLPPNFCWLEHHAIFGHDKTRGQRNPHRVATNVSPYLETCRFGLQKESYCHLLYLHDNQQLFVYLYIFFFLKIHLFEIFVYSFIHSFIHSFIYLFIYLFIYVLLYLLIYRFLDIFLIYPLTDSYGTTTTNHYYI